MRQSECCPYSSGSQLTPRLVSQSVRFFAHLVLLLRTLGQTVPDEAANTIIQAYLRILEREGNDELVAMYAACLREGNGEESYARFLRCASYRVHVFVGKLTFSDGPECLRSRSGRGPPAGATAQPGCCSHRPRDGPSHLGRIFRRELSVK